MFFIKAQTRGHFSLQEKIILKTMLLEWSVPQVRDVLRKYFDFPVNLNRLYKLRDNFKIDQERDTYKEDIKLAHELIKEIEQTERYTLQDEVKKTQTMRMAVDARIMEQVENSDRLSLKNLNSIAEALFKREQLLMGKPTSIAGKHKEMSDEELKQFLMELKDADSTGEHKNLAETDSPRIDAPKEGGADTLLSTSSEARTVLQQQGKGKGGSGGK